MPARPTILCWKTTAVDRKARKILHRTLILNTATLPADEREAVIRAARTRAMIKFRPLFREIDEDKVIAEVADNDCQVFVLPEHYEDEEGQPLSVAEFADALSGQSGSMVMGDPGSVLRIGPTDIAQPNAWTVEKANTLDHFLEVVNYLIRSQWVRTPVGYGSTLKADGSTGPLTNFRRPDLYTLNSILVLIRQLHLPKDQLFAKAVEVYLQHCSDDGKRAWVEWERDAFRRVLEGEPFPPLEGLKGGKLVDRFLYGFGLIHRTDPADARKFGQMIRKHGPERVVVAFHGTLLGMAEHANNVAIAVTQDLAHWTAVQHCAKPDRVSFREVLGTPETW
jgi:hypothetical protein